MKGRNEGMKKKTGTGYIIEFLGKYLFILYSMKVFYFSMKRFYSLFFNEHCFIFISMKDFFILWETFLFFILLEKVSCLRKQKTANAVMYYYLLRANNNYTFNKTLINSTLQGCFQQDNSVFQQDNRFYRGNISLCFLEHSERFPQYFFKQQSN